jgi:hypothetical protein
MQSPVDNCIHCDPGYTTRFNSTDGLDEKTQKLQWDTCGSIHYYDSLKCGTEQPAFVEEKNGLLAPKCHTAAHAYCFNRDLYDLRASMCKIIGIIFGTVYALFIALLIYQFLSSFAGITEYNESVETFVQQCDRDMRPCSSIWPYDML